MYLDNEPSNEDQKLYNEEDEFNFDEDVLEEIESEKKQKNIIILSITAIVLIIGGVLGYYFFKKNNGIQSLTEEFEKKEQEDPKHEEEQKNSLIQPGLLEKDIQPAHVNEVGSIINISSPIGKYFIIMSAFVDEDLAMDQAKKLIKKGLHVAILSPKPGKKFYRLALNQGHDLAEAEHLLNDLKPAYQENLWLIKN